MVNHDKDTKSDVFLKNFLAAGLATVISKTVAAPLERIKLLLQVQQVSLQIPPDKQYKGIRDCFIRVLREQGVLSFWRGNFINVLRSFPTQALNFAFNDFYKSLLNVKEFERKDKVWGYFIRNMATGVASGGSSIIFVYPLDYARTRTAVDISVGKQNRLYKGLFDCLVMTYSTDGLKGLYRGFNVSLQGAMVYYACYFGFFDTITLYKQNSNIVELFFIAQATSITSAYIGYPFDLVSRKMMMMSGLPESKRKFKDTCACWRYLYRNGGFKRLYTGALANVLRGFGSGLVLVLFPQIKEALFENELE